MRPFDLSKADACIIIAALLLYKNRIDLTLSEATAIANLLGDLRNFANN